METNTGRDHKDNDDHTEGPSAYDEARGVSGGRATSGRDESSPATNAFEHFPKLAHHDAIEAIRASPVADERDDRETRNAVREVVADLCKTFDEGMTLAQSDGICRPGLPRSIRPRARSSISSYTRSSRCSMRAMTAT